MRREAGSFGEALRRSRRRAGLTQEQLGRQAGVSVRAVRNIEAGHVRPREESVRRLAAVVGLDAAEAAAARTSDAGSNGASTNGAGTDGGPRRAPRGAAGARLAIAVLGTLTVHRGSRLVVAPPMHRRLLGLLALRPNEPVGHEEIIDTLWGERPPRSCRSLVHTYGAGLRGLLEPARARGAARRVLVASGGGYALAVDDDQLDLLRFDTLAAAARTLQDTDPAAALERWGQALACWRGPVVADLGTRLRRHPSAVAAARRRVAAGLAFADLAIGLGEHQQATARLEELTAEDPWHEGLHARLMLALAGGGQAAAALRLFAELRARLAEELGVEPGAEVRQAHLRVLRDEVPGIPAPDGAAAAPAPRPRPAQLPADVAGFTGRASHLRQLDALLARDALGEQDGGREDGEGPEQDGGDTPGTAVVLTAIAGAAGVGKTALAVHWAHRAASAFGDGQLYVDLQGYAQGPPLTPLQALGGLLHGLGVAPAEVPTETEQAAALYRSLLADKRVLVVLDNAHGAEQVRPLLPGGPGCVAVITSRDRLTGLVATHGAHRLTLDVLSPEEAVALLARILGERRVAAEPAAVRELAEVCGFLPLALRIAAANLTGRPGGSAAEYLAELRAGDRLGALAVAGDPQAAVRVAFDHSSDRLSPDARRLFRLLGLVPGPDVSVPGAAALADVRPELAGRLLSELADAHLLEPRGADRFGLHDLLRLYARQRAEHEDGGAACETALGRLLDWYLGGVDAAAALLYPEFVRLPVPPPAGAASPAGFADPAGATAWLEAERASLVAAVQHAAESGPQPAAWLLADALRGWFWLRRPMVEWLLVAQAGLAAATTAGDPCAQAAGHLNLGLADQATGRSGPALQHYAEALALARDAGWASGQAAALSARGVVSLWSGDLRQAAGDHAEALALYRRDGWLGGQITSLFSVGMAERDLGRLREAAQHQTEALALCRRAGSRHWQAHVLGALGEIDHDLGDLEAARDHLSGALRLCRELGNRFGQALFLPSLAAVDRDAGRGQEALAGAREALALAGEIGDRSAEPRIRNTLASIHLDLGDLDEARAQYREALTLALRTPSRLHEAGARLGLAAVCLSTGCPDEAADHARQALAIATEAGMRVLEGKAHARLAAVHRALGQPDAARFHTDQALDRHRQTGYRLATPAT